ncbi:MAG TPA: hypothetical protein VJQ52_23715 [Steroidobacteraceae bacterium]|nr:hypothetical protein [Steroidobacteraceae bacterium]
MDLESIRPAISGLIGGAVSVWLLRRLSQSVPETCGTKGVDELVQENKLKILVSNIVFFASLAGGVALYHIGYFDRRDWRGLLLVFGIATIAPALFLFVSSIAGGVQRVKEAYVAYAIAQRVPPGVVYAGFALGSICLFVALGSVLDA